MSMHCRLAVLLVLVPLAAPAETLTATWSPRTAREADFLRGALALHAFRNALRNEGSVRQDGRDNLAALSQSGRGNLGVIRQQGRGHSTVLEQSGDLNAQVILQGGRGAELEVVQEGGEIGVTVQIGW
jgi:hypothetical protein